MQKIVQRASEDIPVMIVDECHKHHGHLATVIQFDGDGERIKVECCGGRRMIVNSTQIRFWDVDEQSA
jgi:hypothetical protein